MSHGGPQEAVGGADRVDCTEWLTGMSRFLNRTGDVMAEAMAEGGQGAFSKRSNWHVLHTRIFDYSTSFRGRG
jgi:hypothetical protein